MRELQHIGREARPSDLVPKDMQENLRYRNAIIKWLMESKANQDTLMMACDRDVIFFADTFVWAQDVKHYPDCPDRPWITWEFQEDVLRDIDAFIGRRSLGIKKSRNVGGSTMPLIVFNKHLIFAPFVTLMVASRNEKLVDDANNPDSLFYKLDYMNRWFPSCMTRSLDRKKLTWKNTTTGSSLLGCSTTADLGRGGRKNAILIDEHAAWDRKDSIELIGAVQHNTNCRIWNSTPKGVGNGFHQIITQGNIRVYDLHWSLHPIHNAGMYKTELGKLKLIDEPYWRVTTPHDILRQYPDMEKVLPPSDGLAVHTYPFILDGKLRSPYYDFECLQCPIPKLIAQELDMDFIGSGAPFFDHDEIREYVRLFARRPFACGELTFDLDYEQIKWAPSKEGRMQLWFHPDQLGRPPKDRKFVIGCDVSQGSGQSNSHISVGDTRMRCKIAGFTTPKQNPIVFAEYTAAVGHWFNGAMVVVEGGGAVGLPFTNRMKELGYPNLYHGKNRNGVRSEKPGLFLNAESKVALFTEYQRALTSREFTNPDETAVNECQMYEWTESQSIRHVESAGLVDPSGAKKNHGDRVVGDALDWMLMRQIRQPDSSEILAHNTLAHLHQQMEREEARRGSWSPIDAPEPWCRVRG